MLIIILVEYQPGPGNHTSLPSAPWSTSADFEELVRDALDALPGDIRSQMSNVAVVTEDEPPPGSRCSASTRECR